MRLGALQAETGVVFSARRIITILVAGTATAASYRVFLGWHRATWQGADGYQHGPFRAWEILAVCGVLLLCAAWVSWRENPQLGGIAAVASFATVFAVDAATQKDGDGTWGVGVALLVLVSSGGFAASVSALQWLRDRSSSS